MEKVAVFGKRFRRFPLTAATGVPARIIWLVTTVHSCRSPAMTGDAGCDAAARTTTAMLEEVMAEVIHALSPRRDGPLVKVTCGNLPETLLEAELFGYERGAFLGAVGPREGRVALTGHGTPFLAARTIDRKLGTGA